MSACLPFAKLCGIFFFVCFCLFPVYDGLDKDLPSFHTLFIRDEGSLCMLGGQWVSFHCADVVPSSTDDTIRVKRWLFSVSCKLEMRKTRKTRMSLPSTEPLSWRSPTVDRTEWPLSIFYRDWLKIKVLMIWKRVHPDTDFIVAYWAAATSVCGAITSTRSIQIVQDAVTKLHRLVRR